jgi:hypothetical protein
MPPGVAHARLVEYCQEKISPENSALRGLVWAALPDPHIDFLNQPGANKRVLPLPKLVTAGVA